MEQEHHNKPVDAEVSSLLNNLSPEERRKLLKEVLNVPEIKDVQIATAIWLWNREVRPCQFSVASGKDIDSNSNRERLERELESAGIPRVQKFNNTGPDIIGSSRAQYRQIECKGSGTGTKQTFRNNFDRALASVVSYYTDTSRDEQFKDAEPYLGLALADVPDYKSELKNRLGKPLRRKLNL